MARAKNIYSAFMAYVLIMLDLLFSCVDESYVCG